MIHMKYLSQKRAWLRPFLVIAGTVFLVLGIIGILVPVLPTTPFLLLAAACYARSSRRLYHWLLHNKWFGSYIRDYLYERGIRLRVKIFAITLLWITIAISVSFAVQFIIIRLILVLIAIGVTVYIISIRTLRQ